MTPVFIELWSIWVRKNLFPNQLKLPGSQFDFSLDFDGSVSSDV